MKFIYGLVVSIGLTGASDVSAQETIRSLAAERGRYVGTILNSGWFNGSTEATYETLQKQNFNIVVAENEMKFDAMEPTQNTFRWTNADKMYNYALANGSIVRGHTLAWHAQIPGWVTGGTWTRQTLLAALKNHITTIVGHYKGKVKEWDVVNEAICDWPVGWRTTSCGTQSIWQKVIGDDFIDSAFVWAHAADPDAELYYNDYGLEGGVTTSDKVKFLLTAVDKWVKNGIPITGVGSQTHVGVGNANGPANIRALAKALAKNGLTLQITELDIAFDQGTTLPSATQLQDQGHRYAQYMDVFLEEPNMKTFLIWGLTDKYSWLDTQTKIASALLYDRSYNKKPAYDSLVASLKRHAPSTVITPGVPPVVVEQKPYGASAISLPGKIEAENYDLGGEGVSYHDADAANSGNVYRTDGVDVTGDLGTGYKIGWSVAGEWLEYAVTIPTAGVLAWSAKASSGADGSAFHVLLDSTSNITGNITVSNQGNWDAYVTLSGTTTVLPAGSHTLRLVVDGPYFNLDWIEFSIPVPTSTFNAKGKIPSASNINKNSLRFDLNGRRVGLGN